MGHRYGRNRGRADALDVLDALRARLSKTMQQLPNLQGVENEVIMSPKSRLTYDHAPRTVGLTIVDVNSTEEPRNAISSRTAMVEILGNHFGSAKLHLKDVAPVACQAVPAVKQGFVPESISSDLHSTRMNAAMKDMLNLVSKFLNLGMSIDDVIAVLRLFKGDFGFIDVDGERIAGNQKLICELTLKNGTVVCDLNALASEDWQKMSRQKTTAATRH